MTGDRPPQQPHEPDVSLPYLPPRQPTTHKITPPTPGLPPLTFEQLLAETEPTPEDLEDLKADAQPTVQRRGRLLRRKPRRGH